MDARETALLTLNACERQGGWSDGALKKQISAAGLDSRDAALATQLCAGVLQNQMLLDFYLAHFSNIPLKRMEGRVVQALRLGAYQMLFLDRIPHSAAVNRTVELTRATARTPGRRGWSTASSAVWRGAWSVCPPSHSGTRWSTCPSCTAIRRGWCGNSC